MAEPFRIFLSYRRDDAADAAGRLWDALQHGIGDESGFARDQIFMDIDTIEPGVDFRRVIREAVASCDVFIAVIGRLWLQATDPNGRRRLDNPADFVRLEIEAALERGDSIYIVPTLVQGVPMPSSDELPKSLEDFAHRHAIQLTHASWAHDVGKLVSWLKREEKKKKPATTTRKTTRTKKAATPTKKKAAPTKKPATRGKEARPATQPRAQPKARPAEPSARPILRAPAVGAGAFAGFGGVPSPPSEFMWGAFVAHNKPGAVVEGQIQIQRSLLEDTLYVKLPWGIHARPILLHPSEREKLSDGQRVNVRIAFINESTKTVTVFLLV